MEITSIDFVLLSIISIFIFYQLNNKYRVIYLTILSCAFIASYNYYLLVYIIAYALINYYIGIKIPDSKYKKILYRTGIFINLSQIIILRYSSFAIDPLFRLFNVNSQISRLSEIILPIGISYFTLQGIGYIVNVKMGWEKPEKKFLHFLLYIIFYPKFLSGPIERSNHFLPQLQANTPFNEQKVTDGLRIALFGFFKKLAIANPLAPYIHSAYANLNSGDGYSFWILFLLQPLYLYFDFSGYTDIAIGMAKTLSIELLPNFNRPFLSENMTTFWKRFHISLSSWFNDYVFRQLSFKYRKWGIYASIYSVLVTWILFGIWHGAGWNFMCLGLLMALAINYEFFTKKIRVKMFSRVPDFFRIWFSRMITYLFYCVAMVFFFSPNINAAFTYFSKLTRLNGPKLSLIGPLSLTPFPVLFYIIIFLTLEIIQNDYSNTYSKIEHFWSDDKKRRRIFRWAIYTMAITILYVAGNKVHQFEYVNF